MFRRIRYNITLFEFIVYIFLGMLITGVSPVLVISLAVLLIVLYFVLNEAIKRQGRALKRKEALRQAGGFLSPYRNIWKDLKLTNKYCHLRLLKDGVTIIGKEKVHPYRRFDVVFSSVHDYKDLWEMFCKSFSYNTRYDNLLEFCHLFKLRILEYEYSNKNTDISEAEEKKVENKPIVLEQVEDFDKLDINNCSEVEMTALPGISIVMSKKAIKRRDEIHGFKTIDEFFSFLKLKPHIQEQLRSKITVNKKKGSLQRKLNAERQIDF